MKRLLALVLSICMMLGAAGGAAWADTGNAAYDQWISIGRNYYQEGNLKEAVSAFSAAAELVPSMDLYGVIGDICLMSDDGEGALTWYAKALAMPDASVEVNLYMVKQVLNYTESRELAIKVLDLGIAQFGENGDLLFRKGNLYYNLDEKELALENYLRAAEIDPEQDLALYNASLIYFDQGDRASGYRTLAVSLDVNPEQRWAVEQIDKQSLGYGAYDEIELNFYQELMAKGVLKDIASLKLGYHEAELGQYETAISHLRNAIAYTSKDKLVQTYAILRQIVVEDHEALVDDIVQMGQVFLPKDMAGAQAAVDTFMETQEGRGALVYMLVDLADKLGDGSIYEYAGDLFMDDYSPEAAEYYYLEAMDWDMANLSLYEKTAEMYYAMGEVGAAELYIGLVLERDPASAWAHMVQSWIIEDEKGIEAARTYLGEQLAKNSIPLLFEEKLVIELDGGLLQEALATSKAWAKKEPNAPEVHDWMGKIYAAMGQKNLSVSAHEKSIKLSPDRPLGYVYYAESLLHFEAYDESVVQFEKAMALGFDDRSAFLDYILNLGVSSDSMKSVEFIHSASEGYMQNLLFELIGNLCVRTGKVNQGLYWYVEAYKLGVTEESKQAIISLLRDFGYENEAQFMESLG